MSATLGVCVTGRKEDTATTPAAPPTLDGRWTGQITDPGLVANVYVTLAQRGAAVSGTETLTVPAVSGAAALTVTGSYSDPVVDLFIAEIGGGASYRAACTDSGTRMRGYLVCPYCSNYTLTLEKLKENTQSDAGMRSPDD